MVEVASELGARGGESSGIHLCLSHFTDLSVARFSSVATCCQI